MARLYGVLKGAFVCVLIFVQKKTPPRLKNAAALEYEY